MRAKLITKTMISILLLLASNQSLAGETGLIKRLFAGQKAPYDGTLLDDDAIRDLDTEILEKGICERKLNDCSGEDGFDWEAFAFGAAIAGTVIYIATEYKGSKDLTRLHPMSIGLNIPIGL